MNGVTCHALFCVSPVQLEGEEEVTELGGSVGGDGPVPTGHRPLEGLQVQLVRVIGWVPGRRDIAVCKMLVRGQAAWYMVWLDLN